MFLRAAELLATTWRDTVNAATMLGQSKTAFQSEIDAACELIDFWRFNVQYAQEIYAEQPISDRGMWNQLDYRALEGFVYAVSPFNFTAIGGNLSARRRSWATPSLWKPASSAMLSACYVFSCSRRRAFRPASSTSSRATPPRSRTPCCHSRDLAGVHFTGSTTVFNSMWKTIGENMARYRSYPRIVGETGGKDFIVAHPSADPQAVAVAIARGGFEYQGQKCSAASRVYVPRSLWSEVRDRTRRHHGRHPDGRRARLPELHGRRDRQEGVRQDQRIHRRGEASARHHRRRQRRRAKGYFIAPTLVESADPGYRLLCEEIFGPVVTVHVYPDAKWSETLASSITRRRTR